VCVGIEGVCVHVCVCMHAYVLVLCVWRNRRGVCERVGVYFCVCVCESVCGCCVC